MRNNANEFLQYIAANEQRLKRNLRKNITYDAEIFDDVYQTAIIKVYDSIIRQDLYVEDFEKYFFISSKFEFINTDRKKRQQRNMSDDVCKADLLIDDVQEDNSEEITKIYNETKDYISYEYGDKEAEIFLSYYWNKINTGRTSYRAVADEYEISVKDVASIIIKIKNDFKNKNIKLNDLLYK